MSSVVILILFATISGESDDSDCPEEKVPDIAAVSEAVESGKDAWIFILKHFAILRCSLVLRQWSCFSTTHGLAKDCNGSQGEVDGSAIVDPYNVADVLESQAPATDKDGACLIPRLN